MNAKMQTFAQKFTRKGLRTRVISFERERFDNGGRNIHIDRNSQVQRLHVIRKLYKIFLTIFVSNRHFIKNFAWAKIKNLHRCIRNKIWSLMIYI